jgi:hypothetical protein
LLIDDTVTFPEITDEGYDTVILLVPCPLTIVPSTGIVHNNDVAFAETHDTEYVYSLFGHPCVLITSILPGTEGLNTATDKDLSALVPQPLLTVSDTLPPV